MKNFFLLYTLLISLSPFFLIKPQSIVVNELMSSNGYTISDEDGDYSDWIELFNPQDTLINLSGYGISDDLDNPFKWVFPSISVQPQKHILVFASDKNRTSFVSYWQSIINWGDIWKYRLGTSEPPANWKDLNFDDQSWLSGKSGFGYGDNDDSTIIQNVQSLYVRKTFYVDDINKVVDAVLHVDYDDGFVAYLNGQEIARANIGIAGVTPAYNESATSFVEPQIVYGGKPLAFKIKNFKSILTSGTNVLAIQVHNYGTSSSDLTLIPFLSFGMNEVPNNPDLPNPLLSLSKGYLHTNFKLSSEGEAIVITNPLNSMVDKVTFGEIGPDISLGRQPDGSSDWYLFSEPTPDDSNKTQAFVGRAECPMLSYPGGFYQNSINVSIDSDSNNTIVHYTLDGSVPDIFSDIYTSPILITSTKVLRARAFYPGKIPSKIVTNTYFINFNSNLPVVSLSTDPENLFNEESGIYTLGDSAESSFPYFGANFWKDWEKPVHIDYFENDGSNSVFNVDAGAKIYGAWSRGYDQKSLAIYARGQYGYSSINYKLFKDLPYDEYQNFILRNSGNDWPATMFRDGLMTSLVTDIDLDKQAFKPAVLFINGVYWGIQNIREKVNEHFLAQHYNINADSVNILELRGNIVQGDSIDYMNLVSFIENNNLSVESNFDYVKSKIDINNFIRYFVSEIYFANTDWPSNNIKYWRPDSKGKWRWILYDTDFGFGLVSNFTHNTLAFALEPNGPDYPNPPWSTLLLRKFLENNTFKYDFINCFADYANTIFKASAVNKKINEISSLIEPEISRHAERWKQFNQDGWLNNVQTLRNFANQRIDYLRSFYEQQFNIANHYTVYLANQDTSMGSINLNTLKLTLPSWSGIYFKGIPIKLIAQPKKGFKFKNWKGSITSEEDTLIVLLNSYLNLTAVFEVDTSFSKPNIVFNEINYNSSDSFNPEDWVELYNNGTCDADLSGWVFKDSDDSHQFIFPEGTILQKNSYLVLSIDTSMFKPLFPEVKNVLGSVGFGLSGSGELIRLYDNEMNMIDSLIYDDNAPWPVEADGNGSTLELKNPNLDNSDGKNWAASFGYGTPGKVNDVFTDVNYENVTSLPEKYDLKQNYPNPFNPVTKIQYEIPETKNVEDNFVTLKVYDILGNEIITIINEYEKPGYYEVQFNASNLASGIYFYQLKAGDFIHTKKMVLLK